MTSKTFSLSPEAQGIQVAEQLASAISQDMQFPVETLKECTQVLMKKSRGINRKYIDLINEEVERLEILLHELILVKDYHNLTFHSRDVQLILEDAMIVLTSQAVFNNITMHIDYRLNAPMVYCDEAHLRQAFINLFKNAIEAMPDGGYLMIRTDVEDNKLLVEVIDEGVGMGATVLDQLGTPFVTTKLNGKGLGIAITSEIVSAHAGTIKFESKPGQGTRVKIYLPLLNLKP